MPLEITSPSFQHREEIPQEFTCEGDDFSPELSWQGAPEGTESLALIVDDPDAPDPNNPRTTWVHWVLYNLPPDSKGLPEDAANLPRGAREGVNDWGRRGYGGPCPPIGRHRYFFKLYALDTRLDEIQRATKEKLVAAMKGHVLEKAELIGTYKKKQRD